MFLGGVVNRHPSHIFITKGEISMTDIYEREGVTCVETTLSRKRRRASSVFLFLADGM